MSDKAYLAALEKVKELAEQRDKLREALGFVLSRIDGDIRVTARDINNGIANGNDIYDDCDMIEKRVIAALEETGNE